MNKKSFTVEYKTDDGETKYGQFVAKRASIMDYSQINVKKSQLGGGMYCVRDEDGNPTGKGLDEVTDGINNMIAHIEVLLVSRPEWFKLDNVYDMDLIMKVFQEVATFNNSFRGPERGTDSSQAVGSGENGKENSGTESAKANNGNVAKAVVDQEVHAALEP